MFKLDVRVDYIDTDAMGIVHHASYCRWLERARVFWSDEIGLSYKSMEEQGYALPLRSLHIDYKKPLKFDDRFQVLISVGELDRARVRMDYVLQSEDGAVVYSRAYTDHVLVQKTATGMKPVGIPDEWSKKWQPQNDQK